MARTIEELVAGIAEAHDELDATANKAEELGQAPPELVATMQRLGVPMVKVPTEVGGDQLGMADQQRYFTALAYANPTAAWAGFNNAGAASMAAAVLPDAGVETVFGSNPAPLFAGLSALSGTFDFVEGGVEVSGAYRFASGVTHAEWILLPAIEAAKTEKAEKSANGGGLPVVRQLVVRADDANITGTWDVMALKGTGSLDVQLDKVFVPESLTADPFERPKRGGPMYTVGYAPFVSGENLGFTMGVAQRFMDELATYAKGKSRGSDGRLADRGAFQYEFGKGQLRLNAVRDNGLTQLALADERCRANDGLSDSDEQKIVAMAAYCTETAAEVVSHLFHFAGAGALFNENILQRLYRDTVGSAQHHVISNIAYDRFGQSLLAE